MHGLHETGVITGLSPEFGLQPCTCPLCAVKALPEPAGNQTRIKSHLMATAYSTLIHCAASKGRLYASLWQGEAHNFQH